MCYVTLGDTFQVSNARRLLVDYQYVQMQRKHQSVKSLLGHQVGYNEKESLSLQVGITYNIQKRAFDPVDDREDP